MCREKKKTLELETPEEIAKWREARRKNWPSSSNLKRKQEHSADRVQRGDAVVEEPKHKRGPNWRMEVENKRGGKRGGGAKGKGGGRGGGGGAVAESGGASAGGVTSGEVSVAGASAAGPAVGVAVEVGVEVVVGMEVGVVEVETQKEDPEEDCVAPTPMIETGLFGCYDSSGDDDDAPPSDHNLGWAPAAHLPPPPPPPPHTDSTVAVAHSDSPSAGTDRGNSRGIGAAVAAGGEGGAGSSAQARHGGRPRVACKHFAKGRCHKGARCTFAHGTPGSAAEGTPVGGGGGVNGNANANANKNKGDQNKGYVAYSSLKRHGKSLLEKLTKQDSERQQRILLQCLRHLIQTGQVAGGSS